MSDADAGLHDDVVAVVQASRALVGVAARSLVELPGDVTLPQFRALVVLATRGPQPIGALAAELALHPSTGTRLVDRLVAKRLVRRMRPGSDAVDRRQSYVELTSSGEALVRRVTRRREQDLTAILRGVPRRSRRAIADAMAAFAAAADGAAKASWELGWETAD